MPAGSRLGIRGFYYGHGAHLCAVAHRCAQAVSSMNGQARVLEGKARQMFEGGAKD